MIVSLGARRDLAAVQREADDRRVELRAVRAGDRVHAVLPASSCGKYLTTQSTGFGAAWPRPQIDASRITCDSSSSSGRSHVGCADQRRRLGGADAARRALAAGLVARRTASGCAPRRARVSWSRQHDHRGRADEAAVRLQRVEVERDVVHATPAGCRPTRRPAGRRRSVCPSSMPPQYSSISSLHRDAGRRQLARPGSSTRPDTENERRPLRPLRPCAANHSAPFSSDVAHPVQRLQVVLERRPAEQADLRDVRRAQARHAALAFDRFDHRRLFAADVGAGAAAQLDLAACRASAASARSVAELALRASRGSRGIRRAGRCRSSSMPTAQAAISMPSRKRCGSRSR